MAEEKHEHDFAELGRVFLLDGDGVDLEALSPHGLHDPETGELHTAAEIVQKGGKLAQHFADKVPALEPHVILQCQDPDCPQGPKHIVHVKLTKAEHDKLVEAYRDGRLDPDGTGTNRLVSQASLADLGLKRIQDMLGPGRRSGAGEAIIQ